MNRSVVTGSVLNQFSEPTANKYSPYATLPRELTNFVDQIAQIEYPINSKRELLEKLDGPEAPVHVGENVVNAAELLMFLPATFFPVADAANFAEKLSDYYAQRAPVERRRDLKKKQVQDLAQRFLSENPELVVAVARAGQSLINMPIKEGMDSDVIAARFLKDNKRLVEEVVVAFRGVGRLRASSREAMQEREKGS